MKKKKMEKIEATCGDPRIPGGLCIPLKLKPNWIVTCTQCWSRKDGVPLWTRMQNGEV